MAGAVLGLSGWFFLGNYSAELVLSNNGGIDLIGWRSLQKTLPNLADQLIEEKKIPDESIPFYRQMSDEVWWQKNVLPTYAITKADSKDLASTAGLESAGSSILNLTITARASSREKALGQSRTAASFLLQGGAYLALRSMFNGMQSAVLTADNDLQKKINDTQIELQYQQKRLANLEGLLKRFPGDAKVSAQVVDPKDSGAKYLPISTQIIAANTEVNASKETLERLNDRISQIAIQKEFVQKAQPLVESNFDGLKLNQSLLDLQAQLYEQVGPDNIKDRAYLEGLRAQLLANQIHFTKGLMEDTPPIATKKGMLKATAGGLAAAFFLMLMVLVGQRFWQQVKTQKEGAQ
jgi:hypothetical protein